VTVSDFDVDDAALCGVVVGGDAPDASTAMDLARGVIRSTEVGACVQAEGFDTARLRVDVEYREVGIPLQATSYTLPSSLTR
jgi:hypothetical protein